MVKRVVIKIAVDQVELSCSSSPSSIKSELAAHADANIQTDPVTFVVPTNWLFQPHRCREPPCCGWDPDFYRNRIDADHADHTNALYLDCWIHDQRSCAKKWGFISSPPTTWQPIDWEQEFKVLEGTGCLPRLRGFAAQNAWLAHYCNWFPKPENDL
jgi:hypothetical protein